MQQMTSFARACVALLRPTLHPQPLYWYPVSPPQILWIVAQPRCQHGFIDECFVSPTVNSRCELCKRAEWPTPSAWFPGNPRPRQPYVFGPAAARPLPRVLSGDHSWPAATHACQSAGRAHRCFISTQRILWICLCIQWGKSMLHNSPKKLILEWNCHRSSPEWVCLDIT